MLPPGLSSVPNPPDACGICLWALQESAIPPYDIIHPVLGCPVELYKPLLAIH